MSQSNVKHDVRDSNSSESFRLLSRKLARELTDLEIDAVAGGTNSRTRTTGGVVVTDDAEASV